MQKANFMLNIFKNTGKKYKDNVQICWLKLF